MGSLQKTYNKKKLFGQVYTPEFIVDKILDDVGYHGSDILGKLILDPACGDGRFLVKVVERIIQISPREDLRKNLECVYGWDIDADAISLCIENLNNLIRSFQIDIQWNIRVTNSILKYRATFDLFTAPAGLEKFDFIVGNPPYIRIQHLDDFQREHIQRHYHYCKTGSTDLYIAFFELSLSLLTKNGICGCPLPSARHRNKMERS